MRLRLYSNFSKKVNSTKLPSGNAREVNVVMKRATSIINPTFLIEGVDLNVTYAHLVDANRYYFVNDIVLGNSNIYEVSCTIDVLATFKAYILSCTFMIERSAKYFNKRYNDPYVSVTQKITSRHQRQTPTGLTANNGCYIVRVVGGDADGVSTYVVENLSSLAPMFNPAHYYDTTSDDWIKMVGNFVFNPYDYVVGLYYSPIAYSVYQSRGTTTTIKVKWFDTGMPALKLNQRQIYSKSAHINECDNVYSDFRKYNPNFSRYSLDIPSVGLVPLDGNNAENLDYSFAVNLDTGDCKIWLMNSQSLNVIASYNSSLYSSLQYGSDKQSITQVGSNVLSAIGGFQSGNIPMGITGTFNAVSNIITPTPSIGGSAGGIGLVYGSSFVMYCENYETGTIDVINVGRPLFERRQLSTLSGFTKCEGASIDIACTEQEREMINNYLNGGFFIE